MGSSHSSSSPTHADKKNRQHQNFQQHYYPQPQHHHPTTIIPDPHLYYNSDGTLKSYQQIKAEAAHKEAVAARREAAARKEAVAKAAADKKALETFAPDEYDLEKNPTLFCCGNIKHRDNSKTVGINYYTAENMQYKHAKVEKWSKFRYIDIFPFQETSAHSGVSKSDCFVELQQINPDKIFVLTWEEFTKNFTHFSKEESEMGHHGFFFDQSKWSFRQDTIRKSRIHYSPHLLEQRQQKPPQQQYQRSYDSEYETSGDAYSSK